MIGIRSLRRLGAAIVLLAWCDAAAAQITIDVGTTHQTMEGFGASARVWEDPHLSEAPQTVVPPVIQEEILVSLYTELGLTRMRPTVSSGIEPQNDNDDPQTFDWAKFNFAGKRNDSLVALVKQAMPYGLRTYFPSPVQPERWITDAMPEEHAEWLLAILLRWRALGVELPFISVINEPAERRSRVWSAGWMRQVIKSLGPRMRQEGFQTMLVVPDDLNPHEAYRRAREIMADPDARPYVGALAYHLYGGADEDMAGMRDLAVKYRIPVWMTEYSDKSYSAYRGAFAWILTMHRLIARFGVSAVDYMWGFMGSIADKDTHSPGHTLVAIVFDRGRYRSHAPTPNYYLMGQFSRFVRPGHVRVGAQSKVDGVLVTAYRGPRDIVVVAINAAQVEKDVRVSFTAGPMVGSFAAMRTSPTERWQVIDPVPVSEGVMRTVLPPLSVTTLVGAID